MARNNPTWSPDRNTPAIIFGIDVGNTFSGVSYALLWPDRDIELRSVVRFTDQNSADSKVPSIVYYGKDDSAVTAGASAVTETTNSNAILEGWTKVERFKMQMRPYELEIEDPDFQLGLIPAPKAVVEVMGDFLRYLYEEAVNFIVTHHPNGEDLWEEVKRQRYFVLSLPDDWNIWDKAPQHRMRQVAMIGGLITEFDDKVRLQFVTEGEANIFSCISDDRFVSNNSSSHRFILVDAGGSTVQITPYKMSGTKPLQFEALAPPIRCPSGSLSVNTRARNLLERKLRGSRFDNPDILDDVVNDTFEYTTKREFNDSAEVAWLRLGSRAENLPKLGIRRGSLKLLGSELADCFEPCIKDIVTSCMQQRASCGGKPMPVWLVGGFASSPWLFKRLKQSLESYNIMVYRPEIDPSLAIAHGSVNYLLHMLTYRNITKCTYGIVSDVPYSPFDREHVRRGHLNIKGIDGRTLVPSMFFPISFQNIDVEGKHVIRRGSHRFTWLEDVNATTSIDLYCYHGHVPARQWYDESEDVIQRITTIQADLANLHQPKSSLQGPKGPYWNINLELEITIVSGRAEARLKWEEKGKTKHGPVSVFTEED